MVPALHSAWPRDQGERQVVGDAERADVDGAGLDAHQKAPHSARISATGRPRAACIRIRPSLARTSQARASTSGQRPLGTTTIPSWSANTMSPFATGIPPISTGIFIERKVLSYLISRPREPWA